jgi:hypothetical protein
MSSRLLEVSTNSWIDVVTLNRFIDVESQEHYEGVWFCISSSRSIISCTNKETIQNRLFMDHTAEYLSIVDWPSKYVLNRHCEPDASVKRQVAAQLLDVKTRCLRTGHPWMLP